MRSIAFDSEWKTTTGPVEEAGFPLAERGAGFERARRRRAVVNLGVALVGREHEIVFAGEADRLLQIVEAGDRPLRSSTASTDRTARSALERRFGDRIEIGKEPVVARRVEEHRLGARHRRRAVIDEVIRVRHQHDGLAPGLFARHDETGKEIEPLLGAGEGHDMALGVERARRELVAPAEPIDDRLAQLGGAGHRRVSVPLVRMGGEGLGEQRRRLMLRLADRHRDDLVVDPRRHRAEQRAQRLEADSR